MEQSPSWEANRFAASEEIRRILWNRNVHCRMYKSPSPVPILSQIHPVHAPHSTSWKCILILFSHLHLELPGGLFPSGFPTITLCIPLISPVHATYTAYLILLNFIIRIIFGVKYGSLNFSLCSFLHSPVTLSFLGPNILPAPYSQTHSLRSSLNVSDKVSHPHKTKGKIAVLYIFIFLDCKLEDKQTFCDGS